MIIKLLIKPTTNIYSFCAKHLKFHGLYNTNLKFFFLWNVYN